MRCEGEVCVEEPGGVSRGVMVKQLWRIYGGSGGSE